MNIREQLLKENSKKNWEKVANFIGRDPKKMKELMHLFFTDEYRVVQRASQVMSDISDSHPEMLSPYLTKLIDNLQKNPIEAVRRNTFRLFQTAPILEKKEGDLFELGMGYLKSAEEAIAVKAFAMTSLRRICEKYPDLAFELIPIIEILVEEKASAALVNRGEKELKRLRTLTK